MEPENTKMRKAGKITLIVISSIFILLLGSYLLLRSSYVQTYLVSKVTNYLSKKLNTVARIEGVDIDFFSKVVLEGVYVEDLHHDTLLYAKKLSVGIREIAIDNNLIRFTRVSLENTRFNLVQYKNEKELNLQFIIDAFDDGKKTKKENTPPFTIKANNLVLKNVDFSYHYQNDTSSFKGVNFDHIHLKNINGDLKNIKIIDDSISTYINALSFKDHSGFEIKKLNTDFVISPKVLICYDLNLMTNESNIKGQLKFETTSWDDYNDFEEKVLMSGHFFNSKLNFGDIAYFTEELEGINKFIEFNGNVKGTVANLKGNNMDIRFGKSSHLVGNIKMSGLPDIETTFIQLKLKEFTTNTQDLEGIPIPPFTSNKHIELPQNFNKLGTIKFKGDFTGFQSDFTAYGNIETDLGAISMDIELKQEENSPPKYNGNLKSNNFNLGHFYGIDDVLTHITLDVDIEGQGLDQDNVNATVKGKINELICFNYPYKNLNVEGDFSKNIFSGKFDVNDDNLNLKYSGEIDFTNRLPAFNFNTNIGFANLSKLNIIKSNQNRWLSTNADFNFIGDNIDNIIGTIELKNTVYKDSANTVKLNKVELNSLKIGNLRDLIVKSDALDARISGNFSLLDLEDDFYELISQYIPSAGFKKSKKSKQQDFSFEFITKKSESVSKALLHDIIVKPNSKVTGIFNNIENIYNLSVNLPEIMLYDKLVSNLQLVSNNNNIEVFGLNLKCDYVAITDSGKIENITLKSTAQRDSLNFIFNFFNPGKIRNEANMEGVFLFHPQSKIDLALRNSNITIEDSVWAFNPNSKVQFDSSSISFHDFSLKHNKQVLSIFSTVTDYGKNQININLQEFILSNINPFIKSSDIQLQGILNGNASFSDFDKNLIFTTSLGFKDFIFNDESLGDGNIISLWNSQKESISLNGNFMRGILPTIGFTGFYYPNKKENNLDIELQLKKTPLKLFESFMTGIMSEFKGYASGDLFLQGSLKKPILTGDVDILRGGFKVDYLNTNYTFNGKVSFVENNIIFNHIILFDQFGKEAKLTGNIPHEYFGNIALNINISVDKFFVLNTTEALNSSYYGKAYATGIIKFRGDLNRISIDVDAKTESGTQFNIPLSTPEEISESGFIRFVSVDTNQVVTKEKYKVEFSGIQMNLNLEVTPSAEVQLIFDKKIGDVISGNGSGNINMTISALDEFKMYGSYNITKGNYLFTLKNVINKKFKISEGGTINWTGDPFGADINLEAVYKLRTSLNEVLPSDTSKKRVPVDCVLKMTDKLMNPTIKFDIRLPQSDEKIQNDVKAAINAENESELNKQMFSLLMMGSFFPPNEAIPTGNFGISQNTSELLSSQISNWLSQSNEYVTLGVNVRAGDQTSASEYQASLSTQLFQQRLSIDGNVGVANNPSRVSNLVGDMSVEYKVTADGKLRLRAFTQSNDYTNLTTIAPYTQGIGIFYREDFDTFNELVRNYNNKLVFFNKRKNQATDAEPED